MKIAMIGQKGIPTIYGGIERHVEELSLELAKIGHDVLVYARSWYTPKAIKKVENVRIIHTLSLQTKHLDAITHTFTSTINAIRQKPDVIHYHGVGPSLLAIIPKIFAPKIKVVVTSHCLDRYHQKWGLIARLVLRLGEWTAIKYAHQTITVSKTLKDYYLNEFREKTIYLPNGITAVPEHPGSALIENKWDLQKNKYVLMVSRLVKHKGAHYLLEAWQFAKLQYPELLKDYKLVITGGSSKTKKYVKELEKIAQDDDSIIFTGWQHGRVLEQLYANTALFVHPSQNEGLPVTVLQAMSYGRTVLLSDILEHKEIISDKRYLFNNANIGSLADKLIELFKNKPQLIDQGKINKVFVEKTYNWQDIAQKTSRVYLCDQKSCKKTCLCSA